MIANSPRPGLFNLHPLREALPSPMGALLQRPLERMLALGGINAVYAHAAPQTTKNFAQACLEYLDVAVRVSSADLDRIPRTGPIVVVANHPFGGLEGLILATVLLKVRPDFKVLANHLLGKIPEMRPMCVFVDPFGSKLQQNIRGLKESLHLLRGGGCLGVFPAGEVSHLRLSTRTIEDPKWSVHIAGLIRRTGATVVPVFFEGKNGPMFQVAGLIHPRLRTVLLPRQVLNKRHTTCNVQVGRVIAPRELGTFKTDEEVVLYLRSRTYALAARGLAKRSRLKAIAGSIVRRRTEAAVAIARAIEPSRIERELAALPPEATLARSGDLICVQIRSSQAPQLMREVGRLREMTFRAVGEGTGLACDLDAFDDHYRQLLVWNQAKRELVGGYRLGLTDELANASFIRGPSSKRGPRGLYVHTLFDFSAEFLNRLGPAIELGRSFVRPEYQRSFSPLLLLWKGIGQFIGRHPRYRYLFGPVSISNTYSPLSRALIVDYMSRPAQTAELAGMIRPRTPFKIAKPVANRAAGLVQPIQTLDDLTDLITDIESDGKGVPILLKQYTKLGAKALAFNVDKAFGHCLDCLCVLDLEQGDQRSIDRYMGRPRRPVARAPAAAGEGAGDSGTTIAVSRGGESGR